MLHLDSLQNIFQIITAVASTATSLVAAFFFFKDRRRSVKIDFSFQPAYPCHLNRDLDYDPAPAFVAVVANKRVLEIFFLDITLFAGEHPISAAPMRNLPESLQPGRSFKIVYPAENILPNLPREVRLSQKAKFRLVIRNETGEAHKSREVSIQISQLNRAS